MDIYILMAQRKETYPGEYAPEALDCMDEYAYAENSEWLSDKKTKAEETGEFERVEIIRLTADSQAIMRILRPTTMSIAAVVQEPRQS